MNLCTACNENFTSVTAFDRHQTGISKIVCHDPAEKGLERTADGKWRLQDDGTFDWAKQQKVDKPKSKWYNDPCTECGRKIEKHGRGRPPKKHKACRT